jgi:3-hydroxyacyl-[acyl-carrier-protein] dehydratase
MKKELEPGAPQDRLQEALEQLPHGPEFRFLDTLGALDPGKSGSGQYRIRGTEDFLRGHFPGEAIFPGVLLVEAAAQLAGVVAQSDPTVPPLAGLRLAALRNVKLLGTGRPGEVLQLQAQITGRWANLIQAKVRAAVEERPVLEGELTLSGHQR